MVWPQRLISIFIVRCCSAFTVVVSCRVRAGDQQGRRDVPRRAVPPRVLRVHQRELQEGARRAQVHLEGGQALLLRLLRRALRQPLLPLLQAHRRCAITHTSTAPVVRTLKKETFALVRVSTVRVHLQSRTPTRTFGDPTTLTSVRKVLYYVCTYRTFVHSCARCSSVER